MNYISLVVFIVLVDHQVFTLLQMYIYVCVICFSYMHFVASMHIHISKYHLNGFKCNNFLSFPPFKTKMHLYACV